MGEDNSPSSRLAQTKQGFQGKGKITILNWARPWKPGGLFHLEKLAT